MFNLNKMANRNDDEIIVEFDGQELSSLFALSTEELELVYNKLTSEGEDMFGSMQNIVYLCEDCYSIKELSPEDIGYASDENNDHNFNSFLYIQREDMTLPTMTCTFVGNTITYDLEYVNKKVEYLRDIAKRYNVEHDLDEEGKTERWNRMSPEQQKKEMERKRYFAEE